jgi:hypothetical protein
MTSKNTISEAEDQDFLVLDELRDEVSPEIPVIFVEDRPPVRITYYVARMTPELEERMQVEALKQKIGPVYAEMLEDMLASWDLRGHLLPLPAVPDEDDAARVVREAENVRRAAEIKPLPLTREYLDRVANKYLSRIVTAITESQKPPKLIPKPSRGSF